jgi:hypothetical protein
MVMPETAVNEDDTPILGQNNVGTAWQVFDVFPKPKPFFMQLRSQLDFDLRFGPANCRHCATTLD